MSMAFLKGSSLEVAPKLLGQYLVRQTPAGRIKVKIVETEAYHQEDPASHSFRGNTPRTWPMFEAGGKLYIYFSYGMHYAVNIVVGPKGVGEAVLVRAAEPIEGIDIIRRNRGVVDEDNLTNGPAKLAQALGIRDTKLSGKLLGKSTIWLEPGQPIDQSEIVSSPRIGIKKAVELPWRFYLRGNRFVSR